MRHRNRIHVPGGTYYTIRRSERPHLIFECPADYSAFEEYLELALAATGMKLLGYCWMPDAIHLALRVGRKPVSDLIRRLTRYCIRRMRERSGARTHPFSSGFPTILVDSQTYLPQLIQYLHYLPVLARAVESPDDSMCTSYAAYLGRKGCMRVNTKELLLQLQARSHQTSVDAFAELMALGPSNSTCTLLAEINRKTPILGDASFISRLPGRIRDRFSQRDAIPSLDQVVAFVAESHGVSREDLLSHRRQHELVVARARVAWLASELGAASLSETARCLQRDVSSLGRALSRYLRATPELFSRDALSALSRESTSLHEVRCPQAHLFVPSPGEQYLTNDRQISPRGTQPNS